MTKAIEIAGKEILIHPPKQPSEEIKEVLGGRKHKPSGGWLLPPTSLNVRTLVDWYGKEILEGAPWIVKHLAMHDWGFTGWSEVTIEAPLNQRSYAKRAKKHPRWDDLYDFQKDAVEYMTSNPHNGAILALEPGLGKAPASIVAMDVMQLNHVLIVAPLTLARNWERELEDWSQYYRSWTRATRSNKDPMSECVITNFEVLFEPHFYDENGERVEVPGGPKRQRQWINEGPKVRSKKTGKLVPARRRKVEPRDTYDQNWDLIIIDESVLLKNRKAVKVEILMKLIAFAGQVWLLSGSPTASFRTDLFPQLRMIMPRGFRSFWRFADFFCTIDRNQWGWKITGDRPDHEPSDYLRDFVFIRSQKDVLPELPEYIFDPIEIDLNPDQQKAFDTMADDWYVELEDGDRVEASIVIAQMNRLAQITSNLVNIGGKRSSAKEDLLMEMLAVNEIQLPMIVWCWWVPTAHSVYDRLYDETDLAVDYVTGKLKREDKDAALDAYRNGQTDVLVLQMGVGKFGHTLTSTRTVFYHDRHFDSDAYFQSLRRVRRIGLEHRPRLIVPRAAYAADPVIELNLSGKLQSIARLGNRDLEELLSSLGRGGLPWSINRVELDD